MGEWANANFLPPVVCIVTSPITTVSYHCNINDVFKPQLPKKCLEKTPNLMQRLLHLRESGQY